MFRTRGDMDTDRHTQREEGVKTHKKKLAMGLE